MALQAHPVWDFERARPQGRYKPDPEESQRQGN
jgi:hypothetical protein